MLARVDHNLLVAPEVHPHALAKTARYLKKMPMLRVMWPRVKAMVLHAMPSVNEAARCDVGCHTCNRGLNLFEFEQCV
jgi:hypothetical protein